MNNSDKVKFSEIIVGTGEIYNKTVSKALMAIYFDDLSKYTIEQVDYGFSTHRTDPEHGTFFPKPADIIRHIKISTEGSVTERDRAKMAWVVVISHLETKGAYASLQMDDKVGMAAVNAIGGMTVLSSQTYDQLQWTEKRFIEHYESFDHTPAHLLPASIPGLEDLHKEKAKGMQVLGNLLQQVEDRTDQKLIGDDNDN